MFYSSIYAKYFPLTEKYTYFNEEEKRKLCKWVSTFRNEVLGREMYKINKGYYRFQTYDMGRFDEDALKSMIEDNCFDEKGLAMLNSIIYRHKNNAILSLFCFPMITRDKAEKLFGNSTK